MSRVICDVPAVLQRKLPCMTMSRINRLSVDPVRPTTTDIHLHNLMIRYGLRFPRKVISRINRLSVNPIRPTTTDTHPHHRLIRCRLRSLRKVISRLYRSSVDPLRPMTTNIHLHNRMHRCGCLSPCPLMARPDHRSARFYHLINMDIPGKQHQRYQQRRPSPPPYAPLAAHSLQLHPFSLQARPIARIIWTDREK